MKKTGDQDTSDDGENYKEIKEIVWERATQTEKSGPEIRFRTKSSIMTIMKNPHKTEYITHVRKTVKYCHVLDDCPFDVSMVVTQDLIMVLKFQPIQKMYLKKLIYFIINYYKQSIYITDYLYILE